MVSQPGSGPTRPKSPCYNNTLRQPPLRKSVKWTQESHVGMSLPSPVRQNWGLTKNISPFLKPPLVQPLVEQHSVIWKLVDNYDTVKPVFFVCHLYRELHNLGDFTKIIGLEYSKSHAVFNALLSLASKTPKLIIYLTEPTKLRAARIMGFYSIGCQLTLWSYWADRARLLTSANLNHLIQLSVRLLLLLKMTRLEWHYPRTLQGHFT